MTKTIISRATTSRIGSEPQKFTKRIGSTNYEIRVHFNTDADSVKMEDKLLRIIEREVSKGA